MNVVGDKGIVLMWSSPMLQLVVIEESKEEVVGIDHLPSQEMVGQGPEQKEDDRACGGDIAGEADIY